MSYQEVTGSLMPNSHPGSYCGQDVYNDMFVTEKKNEFCTTEIRSVQRIRTGIQSEAERLQRLDRLDFERGGTAMPNSVRRLTPLECERLQGFSDGWTLIGEPEEVEVKDYDIQYDKDGNEISKTLVGSHKEIEYFYIGEDGKRKRCTDSARYKALGNSICLPFWFWLLRRISAQYERPATLGSLFDGISGFPLVWTRCNGIGTALWSSEIDPFCVSVAKQHFGDDDAGTEGDIREFI